MLIFLFLKKRFFLFILDCFVMKLMLYSSRECDDFTKEKNLTLIWRKNCVTGNLLVFHTVVPWKRIFFYITNLAILQTALGLWLHKNIGKICYYLFLTLWYGMQSNFLSFSRVNSNWFFFRTLFPYKRIARRKVGWFMILFSVCSK